MPEITDSITGEVVEGMEAVEVDVYRHRLARAYSTALENTHKGGRVEIHLGETVMTYLRDQCAVEDRPFPDRYGQIGRPTAWGFPVMASTLSDPHTIAVHVVYDIY